MAVRHPPPHGPRHRHHARWPARSASASAKSSTMSAKPSTSRCTGRILADTPEVRVPRAWPELSTRRLLTLDWLTGDKLLVHKDDELAARNRLAVAMFKAWWQPFSRYRRDPWRPASRQLHRVPGRRQPARHQPPRLRLHPHLPAEIRRRRRRPLQRAACRGDRELVVHAYETWGFKRLSREMVDTSTSGRASSTARCSTTASAPSPTG